MIQTDTFWTLPYWQRLALGVIMLPLVVLLMAVDGVKTVVLAFVKLLRNLTVSAITEIGKLYSFYRYEVLSPNPARHLPKPRDNIWDVQ